jgi:hypothetical protein
MKTIQIIYPIHFPPLLMYKVNIYIPIKRHNQLLTNSQYYVIIQITNIKF